MRRFELLVNEVRENTDTTDINSVRFYEIMRFFNDGQKQLQKIIYTANQSADIFVKTHNYTAAAVKEYALPLDIYAHNSVVSLHLDTGSKLTRLANTERTTLYGYSLVDKEVILSFLPQQDMTLNYVYKVPALSYRLGKIDTVTLGTGNVTIDAATIIGDTAFQDKYDRYSIVDKDGNFKAVNLELTDFTGLSFTFSGDLDGGTDYSGATVGDYIVCGQFGTSHSHLPDECEPYLMAYVQRRILAKLSSSEISNEAAFTQEERADIEDLFKDNIGEPLYPVSHDTDYLGY